MENKIESTAVLMTCHNRRETTLRCLNTLYKQENLDEFSINVYLVDDGSTDGTAQAVRENYPEVHILKGNGGLYWTGGMRKAMGAAMEEGYDFYLWLNDDIVLYPNALKNLFKTYFKLKHNYNKETIVAGNFFDPVKKEASYGGRIRDSKLNPLRFKLLIPKERAQQCDVLNGNLALLSSEVVKRVGNLHKKLRHGIGDFEYSLRARKKGIESWIPAGFQGECTTNNIEGTWKDNSISLINRYKKLFGEKGYPVYPRYIYLSNYGNILWPFYFVLGYLKPLFYKISSIISK